MMKKRGLLFVLGVLVLGGLLFSSFAEAQPTGLKKQGKVPPGFSQGNKAGWEAEYPLGWKRQGVFLDSVVQGLFYTTPTLSGTTGPDGTFRYYPGEGVCFYVGYPGGIFLGEAPGQPVVTPVEVAGAADVTDQAVINIARLLQTLDADGDNNNGIQITPAINAVVASKTRNINFDQTTTAFGTDPEVTGLLADLNGAAVFTDGNPLVRSLKPAKEARDHLIATLSERIIVKTTHGKLRGYGPTEDTWQFLGIPYAKPPVGDLRWRPPQPLDPWIGIREATAWGNQAPQAAYLRTYLDGRGTFSEDCLQLNITAPRSAKKLPVMVWFHGGGFGVLTANTPLYNNPDGLPSKGVVQVSVNHRLGAFGYVSHPLLAEESGYGGSNNYGQMDLIMALEWVRDNIAKFGGDPKNVTIFGQSGGGGKVVTLMASPLAVGLFHKAICMAGQYVPDPFTTVESSIATNEAIGLALFERIGATTVAEARQVPWTAIVQADAVNGIDYGVYRPAVDHYYLPKTMYDTIIDGQPSDVPFMSGATNNDNAHLILGLKASMPFRADHASANQYVYKFSRGEAVVVHGGELQYLFQYPSNLYTPGKPPWWTDDDYAVSNSMMDMFTNFAKTGNPSIPGFTWPAYTTANDTYVLIDLPLEVRTGLESAW
ncbi:MAG: carboxylesterase family protein [Deltaproteobacteria bacterium]|nr:carboxylesterase family protein [Deltaproteobacteria bacterium]